MTQARIDAQRARVDRISRHFDEGDQAMVSLVNGLSESYGVGPLAAAPAGQVCQVEGLPGASGGSGLEFGGPDDPNSDLYSAPAAAAGVNCHSRLFPPTPKSPVGPFLAPGVAADPIGFVTGRRAALASNSALLGRVRVNPDAVVPSSPCYSGNAEPTGLVAAPVASSGSIWGWLIAGGLVIAALAGSGDRSRAGGPR